MNRRSTFCLALGLLVLGGCSQEAAFTPLEPEAQLGVAAAPAPPAKVTLCHTDGRGRLRPLTVSAAAESAHLAHGDLPFVGHWSGFWYVDGVPRLYMNVTFREDCSGLREGAVAGEIAYGRAPYCWGTWTVAAPVDGYDLTVREEIVPGDHRCGLDVPLGLTFDPSAGTFRADILQPDYEWQWGVVSRAP